MIVYFLPWVENHHFSPPPLKGDYFLGHFFLLHRRESQIPSSHGAVRSFRIFVGLGAGAMFGGENFALTTAPSPMILEFHGLKTWGDDAWGDQ